MKKLIFIIIIMISIIITGCISNQEQVENPTIRDEYLTTEKLRVLIQHEIDFIDGLINNIDGAEIASKNIRDFVSENPNMKLHSDDLIDKQEDGPSVLLWVANKWYTIEKLQEVRYKHTAEVYYTFIELYPNHEKTSDLKIFLKVNGFTV